MPLKLHDQKPSHLVGIHQSKKKTLVFSCNSENSDETKLKTNAVYLPVACMENCPITTA